LVRRKLTHTAWPDEVHEIGTERIAQIKPICSIPGIGTMETMNRNASQAYVKLSFFLKSSDHREAKLAEKLLTLSGGRKLPLES
jgi:hypothetical protein